MELTLRDIPHFPPPWAFACTAQTDERRGRIAARRSFVALKLCFMRAAAELRGVSGEHLQTLVRQASEPIELWLIRGSLLAALERAGESGLMHSDRLKEALHAALQEAYPERPSL
ncbi:MULTISPECIES: hypothetical protein [Roseateles]|jgi:hypothetical protein|uniref:hypothetical protein n=1 Tax=Roseateles TaxID=93681 RepID=UPI0014953984|nr:MULTISPECIES: hypothetical protein [Roseateles]WIV99862.1 hypothetical protein K9V56_010490 [Paucibacter aquatile]